jgi:hypothetical protein
MSFEVAIDVFITGYVRFWCCVEAKAQGLKRFRVPPGMWLWSYGHFGRSDIFDDVSQNSFSLGIYKHFSHRSWMFPLSVLYSYLRWSTGARYPSQGILSYASTVLRANMMAM